MSNRYPTEALALEACLKVWEELARITPSAGHIYDLKKQAYLNLGLPPDLYYCPCCEFAKADPEDPNPDCQLCPLWDCSDHTFACELDGSPYEVFRDASTRENAKYMVQAIRRVQETGQKLR